MLVRQVLQVIRVVIKMVLWTNVSSTPGSHASITITDTQKLTLFSSSHMYEGSIYLAPSSVTGNPGLGLYTTRDIRKGENVLRARDSISIPIFDLERGPASTMRYQWFNLFKKYFWAKGVPAHSRFEARFVVDFQVC